MGYQTTTRVVVLARTRKGLLKACNPRMGEVFMSSIDDHTEREKSLADKDSVDKRTEEEKKIPVGEFIGIGMYRKEDEVRWLLRPCGTAKYDTKRECYVTEDGRTVRTAPAETPKAFDSGTLLPVVVEWINQATEEEQAEILRKQRLEQDARFHARYY